MYIETFLGSPITRDRLLTGWQWLAFTKRDFPRIMGQSFTVDRDTLNVLATELSRYFECTVETFINAETLETMEAFLVIGKTKADCIVGRDATTKAVLTKHEGGKIAADVIIPH